MFEVTIALTQDLLGRVTGEFIPDDKPSGKISGKTSGKIYGKRK